MIATLVVLSVLAAQPPAAPAPTPTPTLSPSASPAAPKSVTPAEGPIYPLGPLGLPDFLAAGDPFTLTDLRYGLSDPGKTTHSFAARVRFKDRGYLGAEFEGERRGVSLMTHRVTLAAFSDQGAWDLSAGLLTSRLAFSADARRRGAHDKTWLVEPALSWRVTRDFELGAWTVADTGRPGKRNLTELGGELFLQRGARWAAHAELVRRYTLIETRDENRRDSGALSSVAQVGPVELTGRYSIEDLKGRFARRESEVFGRTRVPLGERWLIEGDALNRFDHGSGELVHDYHGALSWFGRRFTLPRAGRAAERAVALARRATESGEYQLSAFTPDALRLQRERLSLSPRRESFREDMAEVYRSQVEERSVPLLGLGFRDRADALTGETVRAAGVFLGMPWPPAWPWRPSAGAVPFLQLDYQHEWHTTATDYRSGADSVSLTVALSREMDLVVAWRRAQATALDVIRGIREHHRFEISYRYARGR